MSTNRQFSGGLFTAQRHSTTYNYISPLQLHLAEKHVLVTGAAHESGVGFAAAIAFAKAGASAIAIADIHGISEELAAKLKSAARQSGHPEPSVVCCTVDISNLQSVQNMQAIVAQSFGDRLDIVINNAAHMEPYKSMLESDPDTYWRTWEVNVHGLINMARTFLPAQLSSFNSYEDCLCTMINVSSSGALSVRPGGGSYRSSKLAVIRWTESLQMEYGDKGLVTFCVNPGAIKTELSRNEPDAVRDLLPDTSEMAGDTIAWLASERREWLGGRYVSCPWDMEELVNKQNEIVHQDLLKMRMAF